MTTPNPASFDEMCVGAPDHATALMDGTPSVAEQNARNPGSTPPVDRGQPDALKYGAPAQMQTWTGAS